MNETKEPYRYRVRIGDRVRMPDGRTGAVTNYDFPTAPNFLRVFVKPDRPTSGWRRHLPVFRKAFIERAVDRLTLLERA